MRLALALALALSRVCTVAWKIIRGAHVLRAESEREREEVQAHCCTLEVDIIAIYPAHTSPLGCIHNFPLCFIVRDSSLSLSLSFLGDVD